MTLLSQGGAYEASLSEQLSLGTALSRTLTTHRETTLKLILGSQLASEQQVKRSLNLQTLLYTSLARQQSVTEAISNLLTLKTSQMETISYQSSLQQFLDLQSSTTRLLTISRALEQETQLSTSLSHLVGYKPELVATLSLVTILETSVPTDKYTLQATLTLKAIVNRQISVSVRLSSVLQLLLDLNKQVTTPQVGGHGHTYVPDVITVTLHPIETISPSLSEVWQKSVAATARVTVENHLDDNRTVTIVWWTTIYGHTAQRVNGSRQLELDTMHPTATAVIDFKQPVDTGLIPNLDGTYAFHCYVKYPYGQQIRETSQLITLFTLTDKLVNQHLIMLGFIILVMSIVTVVVYFQRENEKNKPLNPIERYYQ